jgi:hypothetical protein
MQTLVGRLEWWAENSRRGTTTLAPLYSVSNFGHPVEERSQKIRAALGWWLGAAKEGRLKDEIILGEEYQEGQESIWSDCGDKVAGAWWRPVGGGQGMALWVPLSQEEQDMGSGPRELLSLRRCLEVWGSRWRGKTVFWCTDSAD